MTFVSKMRASGYSRDTIANVLRSEISCYYRKLRTELSGGPPLNRRQCGMDVQKKRSKLGASERWYRRRHGGQAERGRKDQGWRSSQVTLEDGLPLPLPVDPGAGRGSRVPAGRRQGPGGTQGPRVEPDPGPGTVGQEVRERPEEATLMAPFMPGAALQKELQKAEDAYCTSTGAKRSRVVERGGSRLIDLFGRNDPWAPGRTCGDTNCMTCNSRMWFREQAKQARKRKEELPAGLLRPGSTQCWKEGTNYSLQCLTCLSNGCSTLNRGEMNRSGRQRHGDHWRNLQDGDTCSPMVMHAVEEHGGVMPSRHAVIDHVEPSPLYLAAR